MIEPLKQKKRLLEDNFDITPIGLEFCFNREDFLNDEFDVDQFVVAHKKRVPLERLRDDLIQYFNILKSSLIELINQDYTDFVNLSTNLVGLDRAIKTIQTPLEKTRDEIKKVEEEIRSTIQEIEKRIAIKQSIREKKNLIHTLRSIDSCVSRLEKWLKIRGVVGSNMTTETQSVLQENRGEMLERVGTEFSKLQFFIKKCQGHPLIEELKPRILGVTAALQVQLEDYCRSSIDSNDRKGVRQALRTYLGIDKVADAELLYREHIVRPKIRLIINEKRLNSESLPAIYESTLEFLEKDFPQIQQHIDSHNKGSEPLSEFDFLVNSFWPEVVEWLTKNLSSIFAPGNPDVFYERYTQSLSFLDSIEEHCRSIDQVKSLRHHPSYVEFLNKWSLPVYFQIRFQNIASQVENEMSQGLLLVQSDDADVFLSVTSVSLTQMKACWQDGVFLSALRHRFWKITLQILSRYASFIDEIAAKELESQSRDQKPALQIGHIKSSSSSSLTELANSSGPRKSRVNGSPALDGPSEGETTSLRVRLVLDAKGGLCRGSRRLLHGAIATQLSLETKGERGDSKTITMKTLEECLEESLQKVATAVVPLVNNITNHLKDQCSSQIRLVNDVPRQYRKTNRDWPSRPSAYVINMLRPLTTFLEETSVPVKATGREEEKALVDEWIRDCLLSVAKGYYSQVAELLTSVKKMEDSLKKLRQARGTAQTIPVSGGGENGGPAATDDDKIRHQIFLDVTHFKQEILTQFHLDSSVIPQLDELIRVTELAKSGSTIDLPVANPLT